MTLTVMLNADSHSSSNFAQESGSSKFIVYSFRDKNPTTYLCIITEKYITWRKMIVCFHSLHMMINMCKVIRGKLQQLFFLNMNQGACPKTITPIVQKLFCCLPSEM